MRVAFSRGGAKTRGWFHVVFCVRLDEHHDLVGRDSGPEAKPGLSRPGSTDWRPFPDRNFGLDPFSMLGWRRQRGWSISRHMRLMIVIAALVSACIPAERDWNAVAQQAEAIRTYCEKQFLSGVLGSELATEQCANPAIRSLYAGAEFRDIDILDAYLAKREALAAQLDRKAISPEDEMVLISNAKTEAYSAIQQRANARAVAPAAVMSTMPLTSRP